MTTSSSVFELEYEYQAVMLSPRGQSDLEAKILASASKIRPRPRSFGLGLKHLASVWPRSRLII